MPNLKQNIADAQQNIIDLMFTDIDLAFTFLATAQVTNIPEIRQRNVANAVKAHRTISDKAAAMNLPSSTRQQLETRLFALSQQLAAWGEWV